MLLKVLSKEDRNHSFPPCWSYPHWEWSSRKSVLFTLHNEWDLFSITWQGREKRTENRRLYLITLKFLGYIKLKKKNPSHFNCTEYSLKYSNIKKKTQSEIPEEKKKKQQHHETELICT